MPEPADLDRPRDGFETEGERFVGLLSHDAGRPGVLHLEVLDHQAVVDRPDRTARIAGLQWQLWLFRRFHRTYQRSRRDGRQADER